MPDFDRVEHNEIPHQVDRLIRESRKLERFQGRVNDLSRQVFDGIRDGGSTNDPLLDFALVSCNGIYDVCVIVLQYRKLAELISSSPGQKIIVVQQAEGYLNDGLLMLRNICLASIREGELIMDASSQTMRIPVESGYFFLRELSDENGRHDKYKIIYDDWLTVGPLHNNHCQYGAIEEYEDGTLFVEKAAVCVIEPLPACEEAKERLYHECVIDEDDLSHYHSVWLKERKHLHVVTSNDE